MNSTLMSRISFLTNIKRLLMTFKRLSHPILRAHRLLRHNFPIKHNPLIKVLTKSQVKYVPYILYRRSQTRFTIHSNLSPRILRHHHHNTSNLFMRLFRVIKIRLRSKVMIKTYKNSTTLTIHIRKRRNYNQVPSIYNNCT